MKALILAAGYGTRMRPLTDAVPKCLIDVNGKNLLRRRLDLLYQHGYTGALVNTHYLPDQVEAFAKAYNKLGEIRLETVYEQTLLGGGGTIKANYAYYANERDFCICYPDSLMEMNIGAMLAFHRRHESLLTMAVFHADDPTQCGVVETNGTGRIVGFEEKPDHPRSDLSNAGLYITDRRIAQYIPDGVSDFGKDVLPHLTGRMFAYPVTGRFLDVGNLEALDRAREVWQA